MSCWIFCFSILRGPSTWLTFDWLGHFNMLYFGYTARSFGQKVFPFFKVGTCVCVCLCVTKLNFQEGMAARVWNFVYTTNYVWLDGNRLALKQKLKLLFLSKMKKNKVAQMKWRENWKQIILWSPPRQKKIGDRKDFGQNGEEEKNVWNCVKCKRISSRNPNTVAYGRGRYSGGGHHLI